MQSYVARGGFYPEDYARRIRDIFAEGRIVGYGSSTAAAARRLARGTPWREAGTLPPAASNGSAMHAGPIRLLFHDDPEGSEEICSGEGITPSWRWVCPHSTSEKGDAPYERGYHNQEGGLL
jgi:ADP-ribosylglycohydrolase